MDERSGTLQISDACAIPLDAVAVDEGAPSAPPPSTPAAIEVGSRTVLIVSTAVPLSLVFLGLVVATFKYYKSPPKETPMERGVQPYMPVLNFKSGI
jgi:hypothetical protein